MRRASFVAALAALTIASCSSSFDPASKLQNLRVLAVQKDKPYAHPGDTVHLKLLFDDPRSQFNVVDGQDAGHRQISVQWLSGCFNPQADAFQACIEQFIPEAGKPLPKLGGASNTLDFSLTLPRDLISSRAAPSNPMQPRSGSAFVFFGVCSGTLELGGTTDSPFACRSSSGKLLGADDFVAGYSEIFAYEDITNTNPVIATEDPDNDGAPTTGFQVDDAYVDVDCIGDACIALEQEEFRIASQTTTPAPSSKDGGFVPTTDSGLVVLDAGTSLLDAGTPRRDAGIRLLDAGASLFDAGLHLPMDAGRSRDAGSGTTTPVPAPPTCGENDPRCFTACTESDQGKCDKHSVKLIVTRTSAEQDGVAAALDGRKVGEQMWVNYYTDAGKLEHDVKLLNDATTGWNPNHSADLRVPQTVGAFHVWGVAHDNRGGVQWARITLKTTSPFQ
ncbi:MAG TPA: hypothetical protein VH062_16395 [Polyangiaceae bacterium]|jgi:hypothetical protein|nr:hypothetical protein [Polyangiaceae bacterium]